MTEVTYSGSKKYTRTAWLPPYGLLPGAAYSLLGPRARTPEGTFQCTAPCTRLKSRHKAHCTRHLAQGTRHCTRGAILQQFILNCSFCGSSCLDVFVFCEDLVLSFSVYLFQFCILKHLRIYNNMSYHHNTDKRR